ncbi:putative GNAT family acetyltransferase [Luteibacter sp. 621]|uniref:GNAT family N-acetyltransferase n=1 Tax=Luteibacter sp. 621 TaxID=3373916 RepID=UPI003D1984AF
MVSDPGNETHGDLATPIWSALGARQAHLGEGDALVRRYQPDVAPFAAVAEELPAAFDALHALMQPGDVAAVLSREPLAVPSRLRSVALGAVHQMVAETRVDNTSFGADFLELGDDDVTEMIALTQLTRPGPFVRRTNAMGRYIGLRDDGKLIAMAGERMRVPGYTEVSAVCVHPEWRGKGLAAMLINVVRADIERRGEIPFLHVFGENLSAIALYERLGFQRSRIFMLNQITRAGAQAGVPLHGN